MANKPLSQLLADWRLTKDNMEKIARNLPRIIGTEAVRVIKDNFRLGGYDDGNSVQKWEPRNDRTNNRYDKRYGVKGSVANSDNKVLEQSGDLRDSVGYQAEGKLVKIGVDLLLIPYAEIHNAGLIGKAWGKYAFKMPKRKYMPEESEGPNKKIMAAIEKKLNFEIMRAMRLFKR